MERGVPLSTDSNAPRILGLSGGTRPTHLLPDALQQARIIDVPTCHHDAAAILLCGGRVVAGIEEERLNRVKHTNRLAVNATRACLDMARLQLRDLDRIAIYEREDVWDRTIRWHARQRADIMVYATARDYFADVVRCDLGSEVDPSRFAFVEHHLAHAASAYAMGPFPDALVVTLDGDGDFLSGTVSVGEHGDLRRVLEIPTTHSLGLLYVRTIAFLGYAQFDEYKVMGLAPYGNLATFRRFFDEICVLESSGGFRLDWKAFDRLVEALPGPRRAGAPLTAVHKDLAAALQETVERAALHLLTHYQRETGHRHLCLAGGVAHNSTMIGKIARAGLFDGIFAQPASHDAGCALGAALSVHRQLVPASRPEPLRDVYWGRDIGDDEAVRHQLDTWSDVVDIRHVRDIASEAARLIAAGEVIGWVQGRSEFGPRALGNRSILADPRPVANRDRINALIKQRESYRPFAPSVLDEYADECFEMPPGACGAFMTFTVPVRASWHERLGAVTHVDGTARVQTVSRESNPSYWNVIAAFHACTGVPVLLNTSFNHNVEPIVDSIDDAITCLLTTGLTYVVVGTHLVRKRDDRHRRALSLIPTIPAYAGVVHRRQMNSAGEIEDRYLCEHLDPVRSRPISRNLHRVLLGVDGQRSLDSLARDAAIERLPALLDEIDDLWGHRLLTLRPGAPAQRLVQASPGTTRVTQSDR
jgi:carbamoyltransferase